MKDEGKRKKLPAPRSARRSSFIPHPSSLSGQVAISCGGLFFAAAGPQEPAKPHKPAKPQREPKAKAKIDPALLAKARELRDRYLERANDALLLPPWGMADRRWPIAD